MKHLLIAFAFVLSLAAQNQTSPVSIPSFTVATLPSASTYTGAIVKVTDGTTSACTSGSGSTVCLMFSNGTTWSAVGAGGGSPSAFVDYQASTGVLTGTGSDQTLYTTTIPSIGAGKCLHVYMGWADGGSGAMTIKLFYGSTSTQVRGAAVIGQPLWARFEFCNEPGVTNVQDLLLPTYFYAGTGLVGLNGGRPTTGVFAVDSTASQVFALKANGTTGTATSQGLWWSITQDR
jgi:hypothetical protein